MQNVRMQLAKDLAKDCKTMEDIQIMLKSLFKETIEQVLEAEMDEHLGYTKHNILGNNTGNSRNGYSKKSIKTNMGEATVEIPRDRNGQFRPKIVKKYETTANDLENQILAMYAKGMSVRDIENHLRDIYGIDVSQGWISKITDKVAPSIIEWQNRPLEPIYAVVYMDAIHFNVRQDNHIVSKAAYTVLGINLAGKKDILGIWIGENEGATFWLSVCNDLRNRGVQDILIACKDGLSGFSDAIRAVFPDTDIQLCVIHQIRNSMKYVSYKERKAVMADMKQIYQALTLEEAEYAFMVFQEKWGKKQPMVIKSWEKNWNELTAFFKYPHEIRRIIYTTNTVEGYHRQLRKVTKNKTSYPTDDALRKIIYLATMDIAQKWTMPMRDWGQCLAQLSIMFDDRLHMGMLS